MSFARFDRHGNELPPLPACAIGYCGRCLNPIKHGQPYAPMIPFRGSWGGFMHRHCPPRLTIVSGGRQ